MLPPVAACRRHAVASAQLRLLGVLRCHLAPLVLGAPSFLVTSHLLALPLSPHSCGDFATPYPLLRADWVQDLTLGPIPPRVHHGFLKTYQANSIDQRVVALVLSLVAKAQATGRAVQVRGGLHPPLPPPRLPSTLAWHGSLEFVALEGVLPNFVHPTCTQPHAGAGAGDGALTGRCPGLPAGCGPGTGAAPAAPESAAGLHLWLPPPGQPCLCAAVQPAGPKRMARHKLEVTRVEFGGQGLGASLLAGLQPWHLWVRSRGRPWRERSFATTHMQAEA